MERGKYEKFCEWLALKEQPLGIFYTDRKPEEGFTPKEAAHV